MLPCLLIVLLGCVADAPELAAPDFSGAPSQTLASASGRRTVDVWIWPPTVRRGVDAVRYRIVDAAGAPLDGATVTATPWMPAHGHGTSVRPTVTARGDGVYDIDSVLFFMDGRWELRSEIVAPAQDSDAVTATFDVR